MIMRGGIILLICLYWALRSSDLFALDISSAEFQNFFKSLEAQFDAYEWKDMRLREIPWQSFRTTQENNPLIFVCFGSIDKNCTLILGAVHGDEPPTAYLLFKLAKYIHDNPSASVDKCIIMAPIVNPDGFLAKPPQRFNSNGVDINRNFPTNDWNKDALLQWEKKAHKNKRYYPGQKAGSEQETKFQVALIKRFKPQKIVSLHSPLGFYDFDGPSTSLDSFEEWLNTVSRETDYPLKKFGIFPGSLGNYAGNERNIFTLTLELPSSEASKGEEFFVKFKPAIMNFIDLPVKRFSISE